VDRRQRDTGPPDGMADRRTTQSPSTLGDHQP
jgi:hypothetical protein